MCVCENERESVYVCGCLHCVGVCMCACVRVCVCVCGYGIASPDKFLFFTLGILNY